MAFFLRNGQQARHFAGNLKEKDPESARMSNK
jgi:hypothetical protein